MDSTQKLDNHGKIVKELEKIRDEGLLEILRPSEGDTAERRRWRGSGGGEPNIRRQ
jgi:hypothetical protein